MLHDKPSRRGTCPCALVLRDLRSGRSRTIEDEPHGGAGLSADGRYVLFSRLVGRRGSEAIRLDLRTGKRLTYKGYLVAGVTRGGAALSADGNSAVLLKGPNIVRAIWGALFDLRKRTWRRLPLSAGHRFTMATVGPGGDHAIYLERKGLTTPIYRLFGPEGASPPLGPSHLFGAIAKDGTALLGFRLALYRGTVVTELPVVGAGGATISNDGSLIALTCEEGLAAAQNLYLFDPRGGQWSLLHTSGRSLVDLWFVRGGRQLIVTELDGRTILLRTREARPLGTATPPDCDGQLYTR